MQLVTSPCQKLTRINRKLTVSHTAVTSIGCSNPSYMTITLYNLGQERFTAMTRVYYRRASACVIMFDVAQPNSFHNAAKWKKDLDSKCFNSSGKNIPCILVANKVSILFCSVVTYNTTQRHFLNLCST